MDAAAKINGPLRSNGKDGMGDVWKNAMMSFAGTENENKFDVLYPGRIEMLTKESGWVVYQENQGHLGRLENPANPAAYGQFVYNSMRT